jgi:hypothetical protein
MTKYLMIVLGLWVAATASASPLHFSVRPETGAMVLADTASGRTWEQFTLGAPAAQKLVSFDEAKGVAVLECAMQGMGANFCTSPVPFRVVAKLDSKRAELSLTFHYQGQGVWRSAAYPYAFAMTETNALNLYPHCEGMLVPARTNHPDWLALPGEFLYGGTLSYLACLGVLRPDTGAGLLTLFPNFESTLLEWKTVGDGITVPQIAWRTNKLRFDRPYEIRYCFLERGGYVAMAQRYREWFAEAGLHKTLVAKARKNPAVNLLAGTTVFWANASSLPEIRDMATVLYSNGVDRCLFAISHHRSKNQDTPALRQELASLVKYVNGLGYVTYRYDQFRDAFRPDPTKYAGFQLNTDAWPDKIAIQEHGAMVSAFGDGSGVVCPNYFVSLAKKHLPTEFAEIPYRAWFLDCIGSVTFNFECDCWHEDHPADAFLARRERVKLMEYLNRLGKLTATEAGIDYTMPAVHWYEGPTSLVNYMYTFPPGIVTAEGAKDDAELRTRVKKAAPRAKVPWTVNMSTKYRIPFWSLAHRDEAVSTWRWEDGMDEEPAYWRRKNLWSALYAAPPMYRVFLPDTRKYAKEIGQTQRYVGFVTRRVGLEAVVDHAFLTPDHDVQQTRFASGFGVIANFSDRVYVLPDGRALASEEYVAFEEKAGVRVYFAPPCGNVFGEVGQ